MRPNPRLSRPVSWEGGVLGIVRGSIGASHSFESRRRAQTRPNRHRRFGLTHFAKGGGNAVRMGDFLGKFCVLLRRTCLFLRESTVRSQRPTSFKALEAPISRRGQYLRPHPIANPAFSRPRVGWGLELAARRLFDALDGREIRRTLPAALSEPESPPAIRASLPPPADFPVISERR